MSAEIVVPRCVTCGSEPGLTPERPAACVECGDRGEPMHPAADVTVAINWAELGTIVALAEQRAASLPDDRACVRARVNAIVGRLQAQHPDRKALIAFPDVPATGASARHLRGFLLGLAGAVAVPDGPSRITEIEASALVERADRDQKVEAEVNAQLVAAFERHRGKALLVHQVVTSTTDYDPPPIDLVPPVRMFLVDTPDDELVDWLDGSTVALSHWRAVPADPAAFEASAGRPFAGPMWVQGPGANTIDGVSIVDNQLAFVVAP